MGNGLPSEILPVLAGFYLAVHTRAILFGQGRAIDAAREKGNDWGGIGPSLMGSCAAAFEALTGRQAEFRCAAQDGRWALNPRLRKRFDRVVEEVLAEMPPLVHEALQRVPLHVEDYPSPEVMKEFGLEYRDELCGLHWGIPITKKSIEDPCRLPDTVTLYREGILAEAMDRQGRIRKGRLREEIRITLLHELGHQHGLDEDQLRQLGYG